MPVTPPAAARSPAAEPRPIAACRPVSRLICRNVDPVPVHVTHLAHLKPPHQVPVEHGRGPGTATAPRRPTGPPRPTAATCPPTAARPASSTTGDGRGVRSSQIPPSAVAAIRYRSSSLPARPSQDCAETCTASPSDRARSYSRQMGSRLLTAENSSTPAGSPGAARARGVREQVGQRPAPAPPRPRPRRCPPGCSTTRPRPRTTSPRRVRYRESRAEPRHSARNRSLTSSKARLSRTDRTRLPPVTARRIDRGQPAGVQPGQEVSRARRRPARRARPPARRGLPSRRCSRRRRRCRAR